MCLRNFHSVNEKNFSAHLLLNKYIQEGLRSLHFFFSPFLVVLLGMWRDLNSLTRGSNLHAVHWKSSLNHWTSREGSSPTFWVAHVWIQSRFSQMSHSMVSDKLQGKKQEVFSMGLWQGAVYLELGKVCHCFHLNNYSSMAQINDGAGGFLHWCHY